MPTPLPTFEQLEETIDMIRRHPYFPGKEDVLDGCLEEIDDRYHQGQLTPHQRDRLRDLLLRPAVN